MDQLAIGSGDRPRAMVGRARELEEFRAAFDRMLAGRRQLVLISGEPGIGKTRCAQALAAVAEDQGALVLWGHCREEAGAPPYWPWVQILRAYIDASSLDEVRLHMGAAAKDIAALVPELLELSYPSQTSASVATADSSPARFRTFDAIRQFFHQATRQVPITLILDDLHWADTPSLSLLEFLAQELENSRILIVAAYRDAEASAKSPLQSSLGGLCRESGVKRVHLSGLSQSAIGQVAERLCDVTLSESAIKLIYQRTDGNPLFAIELIKVLLEESPGAGIAATAAKIPAGVRETIGRRLVHLSDACNELLKVAAVHGRRFTARELSLAMDQDVQQVLRLLQPAVRAGLLQANPEILGGYQFTHSLIRETIYEDLPPAERLAMHGRAADALVQANLGDLEPVLTLIAHHYYQAAVLGFSEQAVLYALRAADSAVRIYAYEEALLQYDRAIEIMQAGGFIHDKRLARAYVLKGSALRLLGQVDRSIDVLLEAVNRTRLSDSAELLIDVLVSLVMSSQHVTQRHIVPLLDRVLALLPESDSVARTKALSTLAFALRASNDMPRIRRLVDQSLAMAERCCDGAARCACFYLLVMALRGNPASLSRRLLLGQEYIAVARATGSGDLLAEAYHWQVLNYFEAGNCDDLEALLERYEGLATARFGLHQYWVGSDRITLALLRGEWGGLEARIEQLLEIGTKTRSGDADGVYGAQMFVLNRDLGRLHDLAPHIKELAASGSKPMWEPGLMLICAEIGLLPEARAMFERLVDEDCRAISRDDMYLPCLVYCAQTCSALGGAEHAESLYRLLLPYATQTAYHPTAVCFGSTELYLAMLAETADHPDLARAHFEKAVSLNRDMRAWPYLARSLHRFGVFLLARLTDAERQAGIAQLREAEELARRLGMARLVIDINAALHAKVGSASFPDDLTAREVDVLRLLAIGRTNKDVSRVLAISLNTVATHVRSILNKTQCANRTEAATYAIRHGLNTSQLESSLT